MQVYYGAVFTYFSDAGFRERLVGRGPALTRRAASGTARRSPRCCGRRWIQLDEALSEPERNGSGSISARL